MTRPYRTPNLCPDAAKHTPAPEGFVVWTQWASEMGKTHRLVECATCGFYVIWVKG